MTFSLPQSQRNSQQSLNLLSKCLNSIAIRRPYLFPVISCLGPFPFGKQSALLILLSTRWSVTLSFYVYVQLLISTYPLNRKTAQNRQKKHRIMFFSRGFFSCGSFPVSPLIFCFCVPCSSFRLPGPEGRGQAYCMKSRCPAQGYFEVSTAWANALWKRSIPPPWRRDGSLAL